nr:vesicle-associated membrane protein 7 isoform X3 [Oryctolagus cuniculus]
MTITYSCIANGRTVLAELALTGGSYQEATAKVLRLVLLRAEPRTIMQMGSYIYHTLFIDGITYLCATDNALDTVAPSAFLKKMKYNKNQSDCMISTMRSQVTDVKTVLTQNIEIILEKEEKSNIYLDSTDDLQTPAEGTQRLEPSSAASQGHRHQQEAGSEVEKRELEPDTQNRMNSQLASQLLYQTPTLP